MSLRERLATPTTGVVMLRPEGGIGHAAYQQLKVSIHQKLLDRVDLTVMESLTAERLREEIAQLVARLLADDAVLVNDAERASLIRDIQH
jgi:pilus assembly protein CpaF